MRVCASGGGVRAWPWGGCRRLRREGQEARLQCACVWVAKVDVLARQDTLNLLKDSVVNEASNPSLAEAVDGVAALAIWRVCFMCTDLFNPIYIKMYTSKLKK